MSGSFSAFIRDDLKLTTWLLIGASIQTALVLLLPRNVALLPSVLILSTRIIQHILSSNGLIRDPIQETVIRSRQTAQLPPEDGSLVRKPAAQDMVVFIIGSRSNHPLGRLAPGFQKMGEYFQRMWDDARDNRETSGFLGRSSTLLATDNDAGNTLCVLSYWKDMDSLHAFAHSKLHREGWDWYNEAAKKNSHFAIMHEVYSVPAGRYENIYQNLPPFAMGQTGVVVEHGEEGKKTLVPSLVEAKGSRWKSMYARMGKADGN